MRELGAKIRLSSQSSSYEAMWESRLITIAKDPG